MDSSVNDIQTMLAAMDAFNKIDESMIWNDDYFKKNFMEQNKLCGRMPLHQTLEYAKAFLNWYISGKSGKLLDMWIGLVGGMLVPTDSISHEYLLIDSLFRGKIGENQAVKLDPLEPVSKLTEFTYANVGTEFSSCEAKTWYYHMYDMLNSIKNSNLNSNGVPPSTILAINYMGYIALTLVKVLVKEASKISQHIRKNVTNEFNGFWHSKNLQIKTRTPPPHKFAILQFEHAFQKLSPNCNKILTCVVATYAFTDSFYRTNIRKVLKVACLDYLDLYGMGCLYWLQKAEESCSTSSEKLMDCVATNKNKSTNQVLRDVIKNYANPTSNQHTWRWARLFVDKAFSEISTSTNPEYAATMAALSSKCDDNSPIWNISQFRDKVLKFNALRLACAIQSELDADLSKPFFMI